MNRPSISSHMGLPHHHHHHQASHSSSQLQPNASPLHSNHHTQLHASHHHSHSHPSQPHLPSHYHIQHHPPPEHLEAHRASRDQRLQGQQRANIDHYKSSAIPAYRGYIETTHDALIIFNACNAGMCPKVTRRLHERERRSIDSGAVYVFDEAEAGIKRWTDGRMWSPSRILNNFLVYREIDQKRPAGNNHPSAVNLASNPANHGDASGNNNSMMPNHVTRNDHPSASSTSPHHHSSSATSRPVTPSHQKHNSLHNQVSPKAEGSQSHDVSPVDSKPNITQDGQPATQSQSRLASESQSLVVSARRPVNRERERALVGSLTSSYKFRADGLVKKTISLSGLHMITYYRMEDVLVGRLRTPKTHDELRRIPIHERFLQPAFFRVPPSWGFSNGSFWVQDEGPEETPQTSSGSQLLPTTQSTSSNAVQVVRGSLIQHHSNGALSRPCSSPRSPDSPSAASPVSSNTLPLLAASSLSTQAGPIGRASAAGSSVTRYEPYPRRPRSPPLPASSSVTNNNLTDQQSIASYYAPNQSTGGVNGYSTNSFLSDSHSSLVSPERSTRPDPSAHNGGTLDPIGQVTYSDSGAYRAHTSTSGGAESIYGQYTSTHTNNNSNRSSSVPPSPYGLPSIHRVKHAGQPGSTSFSNTDARGIGDYQFTPSPTQQQAGKISGTNLSHGGSYGAYLSPVSTSFRGHTGGSNLPGRESNQYNALPQPPGSLNNPSGPTSLVSGAPSPTFLYPSPPTSTSPTTFSSAYQYSTNMVNQQPQGSNSSRREPEMATLSSEIDRDSAEVSGGSTKLGSLNRNSSRALQRNGNESSASHWGQINSSHTMKTEEGGSG